MIITKLRNSIEIQFDEKLFEDEILRQCNQSISYNDILNFIESSPYSLFFIDSKLNSSTTLQPDTKYLFFNTGFVRPNTTPTSYIFCSMVYNSYNHFFGGFFGTVEFLLKRCNSYLKLKSKDLNDKILRIQNKVSNEYKNYGIIYASIENENSNELNSNDNMDSMVQSQIANIMSSIGVKVSPTSSNSSNSNEISNDSSNSSNNDYSCSSNSLVDLVYDSLLINNWKQKAGLNRFILIIGSRIQQLIKQNKTDYFIINNINSVVVNTGLLDKYNNDILILYKWYVTPGEYRPDKLIESKKDLIEEDFTLSQTKQLIKPISLFDDDLDMYLSNVDIDDFDISNKSLDHILAERIDRFPEDIRNLPIDVLAAKIRTSLETGVKMLQRDKTYARPSYSGRLKKMSWLIPLHINRSFSEEPELVMVISKEEYYYEIKTIYVYDDSIKDRITAMELYRIGW